MTMTIYRSPACSCCHLWADIARQRVWTVASADKLDMAAFKAESGVPMEYSSCHTTIVGGYFVEGHVPLEAVERLLAEKPDIDGIALPGNAGRLSGHGRRAGGSIPGRRDHRRRGYSVRILLRGGSRGSSTPST